MPVVFHHTAPYNRAFFFRVIPKAFEAIQGRHPKMSSTFFEGGLETVQHVVSAHHNQ